MSADGGTEIPKVPPCQRCGCELELATRKRHAQYYRNEGGELQQW
jgi:hypothetical protein